ncbi:hypothetical protein FKG94_15880 [Exilibacterium tricleocarpae]|uniref:ABM domain-containing protein n=1 Tax=Exilibacterium tricleocarpae TaxID=2591008 RepID=A0A545TBB1_9GAMM|nr:hypothetical protein [Exilibacterium tricleocarpae]TQV74496.1 hypothetical protein FKG94_15880 [Exilibacterium tricleocarpae]
MGKIVIVGYRPKPGKEAVLAALTEKHVTVLRAEGFVTDRRPVVMQAGDGTIIEVFEWKSAEAMQKAHDNPVVADLWREYDEACDYVPLADIPMAKTVFSEFQPLN